MSWRDRLLKDASFRGAAFKVSDHEHTFGRRNVVHQYALSDDPYVEDLGRDTDDFEVVGYVIQTLSNDFDYFAERDALIEALRKEGPGTLIHPYLGRMTVYVSARCNVSESFGEGGIARFRMYFVRIPTVTVEKIDADSEGKVDEAANEAAGFITDGFGRNFSGEQTGFSSDAVQDAVLGGFKMMRATLGAVKSAKETIVEQAKEFLGLAEDGITTAVLGDGCLLAEQVGNAFRSYMSLGGIYGDIVPTEILGECTGNIRQVADVKDLYSSDLDAMLAMMRFGDPLDVTDPSPYGGRVGTVSVTTEDRARQAANLLSVINLFRGLALARAMQVAIRIPYDSQQDAQETADLVFDAIDGHLEKLGDEAANDEYEDFYVSVADYDSYSALQKLRQVFAEQIAVVGANLAKVIEYEPPPDGTTTLQLAHDLYEDIDREEEIMLRNRPDFRHPGFYVGTTMIEVLDR